MGFGPPVTGRSTTGFMSEAALDRYGLATVAFIRGSDGRSAGVGATLFFRGGDVLDENAGADADAGRPGNLKVGAALADSPPFCSQIFLTDVTTPPLPPRADRTS